VPLVARLGRACLPAQQRVPPAEIKEKIEEAFRRSAELDAARITVETDGGTVILKGTVRSWNWIAISP